EQVRFLQYRPVLSNERLKYDFGVVPSCTSAQAFDIWKQAAGL
ncbi:MAG: epimerase, partial [Pseudomonadota bacterium]|nr:epimerase [Pseudomonadota bacterium]